MPAHLHLAPSPNPRSAALPREDLPIRVSLVEDHALMRHGLRSLLDDARDVRLISEGEDLAAAVRTVHEHEPNVLVLDLNLSGGSSIGLVGALRETARATEIVIVTMDENPVLVQRALAAGALGFVLKDLADDELAAAVHAAARGEQYVSPRVAPRLEALLRSLTGEVLTAREVEILRLIALGHTSVEVARRLVLSPRTVETHRAHIFGKLGLGTRAELVRYALRHDLLRV
jgi:two-component system, NarL family, response regulator NreC